MLCIKAEKKWFHVLLTLQFCMLLLIRLEICILNKCKSKWWKQTGLQQDMRICLLLKIHNVIIMNSVTCFTYLYICVWSTHVYSVMRPTYVYFVLRPTYVYFVLRPTYAYFYKITHLYRAKDLPMCQLLLKYMHTRNTREWTKCINMGTQKSINVKQKPTTV